MALDGQVSGAPSSEATQGAAAQAPAVTSVGQAAGGTGGVTTPAAAPPSSSGGGIAASPISQPAGATGLGSTQPTTPAATPPAAPEFVSIRDVVRNYGAGDLADQFTDEHALLQHLLIQRQQAQQVQPWLQQFQQNQPQFQEFLRTRQAAEQQQRDKPWFDKFWQPPEFNRQWERLITRDANGNLSVVPGADPGIIAKYQAYQQFRSQAADRLMENPFTFFEEPVKQLAQQMAQQEIQRHLGGYKDQQFATQFIETNPWLYQRDPSGNALVNPATGDRVLSREGQAFKGYVEHAQARLGINDIRGQQEFALAMVQRDAALAQIKTAPPQTPAQQQAASNQAFLTQQGQAGATHQPNSGPAQSPAPALGNPQVPAQTQVRVGDTISLAERMTRNFQAAGFQAGQSVTSQ